MQLLDTMLIPTYDVPRLYRERRLIGAFIDTDILPSYMRREARYRRDEARAELGSRFNFETAPKSNWKAGDWKGKRALLWKAWQVMDPSMALFGAQTTGDCVSWGERGKQDTTRCVEIVNLGQMEEYIKRQATCLIYSGRGHTGAGASPWGLANWAIKCGILLEDRFTDAAGKEWDFSEYSKYVKIGMQAGRTGMSKDIIAITSKKGVKTQSGVKTIEALCDALNNGKACSVGFSLDTSPRGNPISKLSGRTAHQTFICGFDDTEVGRAMVKKSLGYEDTAIIYDQSWGPWNEVTDIPEEWKPWGQGMYAHSARDCQKHLNEGEAIVCSDVDGFVGTPLNTLLI